MKRRAASADKEGGKSRAPADRLEELLPLAVPSAVEVHTGAAVLEVGDPAQLLELASDTALRPFLLCRLAPTVALVDPGGAKVLVEVLLRRGHTPKVLTA